MVKFEFEEPRVPNFVRLKHLNSPIGIEHLTEEELTEYAELWCERLRLNYEVRNRALQR